MGGSKQKLTTKQNEMDKTTKIKIVMDIILLLLIKWHTGKLLSFYLKFSIAIHYVDIHLILLIKTNDNQQQTIMRYLVL